MKKIAILGSTGSIGTQTLSVVREHGDIEVTALAAGHNIAKLEEQIREFHPSIAAVWDEKKALELKEKLPSGLLRQSHHNQYTLLASAARSANMDRCIQSFLKCKPNGAIIQIGCGLETTYYRCDNSKTRWYAVDLPHVMEYRQRLQNLNKEKEIETVTLMVRRYCWGVHGTRGEALCPACNALLEYARERRDRCLHGKI